MRDLIDGTVYKAGVGVCAEISPIRCRGLRARLDILACSMFVESAEMLESGRFSWDGYARRVLVPLYRVSSSVFLVCTGLVSKPLSQAAGL